MDSYIIAQQEAYNETTTQVKSTRWEAFWNDVEFNRMGYCAALCIGVMCLGGLTMAFGAFGFTPRLIATVATSMALLISFLGLLPMRVIFGVAAAALVVDAFFMGATLFGL